jgi:hypothetical protein
MRAMLGFGEEAMPGTGRLAAARAPELYAYGQVAGTTVRDRREAALAARDRDELEPVRPHASTVRSARPDLQTRGDAQVSGARHGRSGRC